MNQITIIIIFLSISLLVSILPVFAIEENGSTTVQINDNNSKYTLNNTIDSTHNNTVKKIIIKNNETEKNILEVKSTKTVILDQITVSTTLTIILTISTTVLAIVGITSLIYNKKMISEMKTERKYNLKPFVICDVISEQHKNLSVFYIIIHNQGKGAAKNIQIKLTSDHNVLKHTNEFNHEIHLLGPNGKSKINMGVLALSQNVAEIHVELDYDDVFNESFHEVSTINLSPLFGY